MEKDILLYTTTDVRRILGIYPNSKIVIQKKEVEDTKFMSLSEIN